MSRITDFSELFPSHGPEPTVYIVDDEPAVCETIRLLLEMEGFRTRCFQTGEEFLDACSSTMQGCILLDLCMPDYSGLDIQKALTRRGVSIPVIILTGHGTIPSSSEAFRLGAFDFLEKPFESDALLQRVAEALTVDEHRRLKDLKNLAVSERYARLSERERQVLGFVVNGYSSKEMAKEMGISHRTVEIYRAHIMRKMGSESLVDLLRTVTPLFDERGGVR